MGQLLTRLLVTDLCSWFLPPCKVAARYCVRGGRGGGGKREVERRGRALGGPIHTNCGSSPSTMMIGRAYTYKLWLTPIFSRERARTSAPFFWLTKMMMGGSMPLLRREISFFLLSPSDTINTCCSTFSVGLPAGERDQRSQS